MYNWAYLWLHVYRPRSTPEGEAFLSCMEPWAEHGVVVAFPEGSLPSGSGSERDLQTDVAFLEAAVEQLREEFQSLSRSSASSPGLAAPAGQFTHP